MSDEKVFEVDGLKKSKVFGDYYMEATTLDVIGIVCSLGMILFFVWIPRVDLMLLQIVAFGIPAWLIFCRHDRKERELKHRLAELEGPYLTQVKTGERFGLYRFKGFLGQNKTVPGKPHWVNTTITFHTPIIEFNGEDFYVSSKGFTDLGGGGFSIKKKNIQKNEITVFRGLATTARDENE